MRIAAGVTAVGIALVAACSTPVPSHETGTPGKFGILQVRDKIAPDVPDSKMKVGEMKPGEVQKPGAQAKPGEPPKPSEAKKPGEVVKPGETAAKPGDVTKPGEVAKPSEATRPGEVMKPGETAKEAQKPGEMTKPGEAVKPGEQPAGGGGGPQMDQQAIQKVSQALNVSVVDQAQAQSLQQIDQSKIKLDIAQKVEGTLINGLAPQIADILRPHLANVRFSVRNGLFVPMILVGTDFVPVVATISGRSAAVVFVQDCASGALIPNTILL